MTAPHDHRLEQALRDLTAALTATGASWMVIGGIAVIARGVPAIMETPPRGALPKLAALEREPGKPIVAWPANVAVRARSTRPSPHESSSDEV